MYPLTPGEVGLRAKLTPCHFLTARTIYLAPPLELAPSKHAILTHYHLFVTRTCHLDPPRSWTMAWTSHLGPQISLHLRHRQNLPPSTFSRPEHAGLPPPPPESWPMNFCWGQLPLGGRGKHATHPIFVNQAMVGLNDWPPSVVPKQTFYWNWSCITSTCSPCPSYASGFSSMQRSSVVRLGEFNNIVKHQINCSQATLYTRLEINNVSDFPGVQDLVPASVQVLGPSRVVVQWTAYWIPPRWGRGGRMCRLFFFGGFPPDFFWIQFWSDISSFLNRNIFPPLWSNPSHPPPSHVHPSSSHPYSRGPAPNPAPGFPRAGLSGMMFNLENERGDPNFFSDWS